MIRLWSPLHTHCNVPHSSPFKPTLSCSEADHGSNRRWNSFAEYQFVPQTALPERAARSFGWHSTARTGQYWHGFGHSSPNVGPYHCCAKSQRHVTARQFMYNSNDWNNIGDDCAMVTALLLGNRLTRVGIPVVTIIQYHSHSDQPSHHRQPSIPPKVSTRSLKTLVLTRCNVSNWTKFHDHTTAERPGCSIKPNVRDA